VTERDRTMMPRTTPNDLTTIAGNSNVVVVSGWVWFVVMPDEQNSASSKGLFLEGGGTDVTPYPIQQVAVVLPATVPIGKSARSWG